MKSFFAKVYFPGALAAWRGFIRRVEPIRSFRSKPHQSGDVDIPLPKCSFIRQFQQADVKIPLKQTITAFLDRSRCALSLLYLAVLCRGSLSVNPWY
jgi:hypothetical protein